MPAKTKIKIDITEIKIMLRMNRPKKAQFQPMRLRQLSLASPIKGRKKEKIKIIQIKHYVTLVRLSAITVYIQIITLIVI